MQKGRECIPQFTDFIGVKPDLRADRDVIVPIEVGLRHFIGGFVGRPC